MEKVDFYNILCHSSPEELNSFISSKGKTKMINGFTFIKPEYDNIESKSLQHIEQINTQK